MITQDQFLSLLRSLLSVVGTFAVTKGFADANDVAIYTGAALAIAPAIWGVITHTHTNTIKAAEAVPGVVKIVVASQPQADALAPRDAGGEPAHDKILSPSEDLAHVAAQPGVTVMRGNKVVEPAAPAPKT